VRNTDETAVRDLGAKKCAALQLAPMARETTGDTGLGGVTGARFMARLERGTVG